MADTFILKVVTPDGAVFDKPVTSLIVTTEAGEINILPEHRLLLSSLKPGKMTAQCKDEADNTTVILDTGFLEGGPDHVNIISDHCLTLDALDRKRIEQAITDLSIQLEEAEPGNPVTLALEARLAFETACLDACPVR